MALNAVHVLALQNLPASKLDQLDLHHWQWILQPYGYSRLIYEFSGKTLAYNDVPFH